jgi:hypothetical protein
VCCELLLGQGLPAHVLLCAQATTTPIHCLPPPPGSLAHTSRAATAQTPFGVSRLNSLAHTPLSTYRQHASFAASHQQQQQAGAALLTAASGLESGRGAGSRHRQEGQADESDSAVTSRNVSFSAPSVTITSALGINVSAGLPCLLVAQFCSAACCVSMPMPLSMIPTTMMILYWHCRCQLRWLTSGTSSSESSWERGQVRGREQGRQL